MKGSRWCRAALLLMSCMGSCVAAERPYLVEHDNGRVAVVDLEREATVGTRRPKAPTTLQLVDAQGVRQATLKAVRRACHRLCGGQDPPTCHWVGDYLHAGKPLGGYAVGFTSSAKVRVEPLVRIELVGEARKLKHIERVFGAGFLGVDSDPRSYVAGWSRAATSGSWVREARVEGRPIARSKSSGDPANLPLSRCTVLVVGDLTETQCDYQAGVWARNAYVGTVEGKEQMPAIRYRLMIDDADAFIVLHSANSATYPALLWRQTGSWRLRWLAPPYPSLC